MKTYEFGLKHDEGTVTLRIRAENINEAKKIVMELEKCPEQLHGGEWFRLKSRLTKL